MKRHIVVSFSFFFFSLLIQAQDFSKIGLLTKKHLTENANAVVRDHHVEVTIEAVDKMVYKEKKIITILNKLGHQRFFDSYAFYDNDTKIKNLSVKIYNSFGKEIKKYNKSKFEDVSAVDGGTLYSDSRVMYVNYTPISYPYTYEFDLEYTTSTTGFIPKWMPIPSYYLGVERSAYTLINKANTQIRTKENLFTDSIKKLNLENGFSYSIENAAPIKYEGSSLGLRDLTPSLLVALTDFSLKGVRGTGDNWKDFGKWMYDNLIVGRGQLDEATKLKVTELVKGVEDPIEKAKIVYKFVQEKTRYISVQVGIGGWEPIAANQVNKVGYGDCKGLTNYTMALLDVVGVTSYYTVVYAQRRRDIDKDFASMQGTHVILNIPHKGQDIWLECTSQTIPFGFLGNFTDDRDVLVVTPEGGIMKRTQSYKNEENLQITKASIELDSIGNVTANLKRSSYGIQYDDVSKIDGYNKKELDKYYKSGRWSYNNNLEVEVLAIENDKDSIVLKEDLKITIGEYASMNGNEMLLRPNAFNKNSYVPKRYRNRKLPLKVSRGYKDVDTYEFNIPKGYQITVLPSEKKIESKFGSYKVVFEKKDESTFVYKKELFIKAGEYPKEAYDNYRKFRRSIARYENIRIALTKIN